MTHKKFGKIKSSLKRNVNYDNKSKGLIFICINNKTVIEVILGEFMLEHSVL